MQTYLDFEKPVAELEGKISELRALGGRDPSSTVWREVERLEKKSRKLLSRLYRELTPWQGAQVARHPDRPGFSAYVDRLFSDFISLSGDRKFGEDSALVGGIGRLRGRPVVVIGQERGKDTQSRIKHNFGMPRPEGYRKAARLMELAGRFGLPVLALVDTAGAYPGVDAEERGQAEAIARSTEACLALGVPNVAVIIGQGGSGGAIAIATANRVLMMEYAIYTVASPEAAASILWRDSKCAEAAAASLKMTAKDLLRLGIVDGIISEPCGGAHRDVEGAISAVGAAIVSVLDEFEGWSVGEVRDDRRRKFIQIGKGLVS